MAEISAEELNTPQKITEAAILEMINLWKMDYKPADTVDPATSQVPTSKAVYNFVKSLNKNTLVPTGDTFDKILRMDLPVIEVPSDHIYDITYQGKKYKAVDVMFYAGNKSVYNYNAPCFQGQKFTLIAGLDLDPSLPYDQFDTCRLMFIRDIQAHLFTELTDKFYLFERMVYFLHNPDIGKYTLTIDVPSLARFDSNGITYKKRGHGSGETVTEAQAKCLTVEYVMFV